MSGLWTVFLELFQAGIFSLTQFYGGQLGSAILSFSLLARLALLPLGVRVALGARRHSRALRRLAPSLERIRAKWSEDPTRQASETLELYRRHDVSPLNGSVIRGSLAQTPVFIGIYHAVRAAVSEAGVGQRFLWIANLARPDLALALVATLLTLGGAWVGATETQPAWAMAIPVLMTGILALAFSSGFALYLAAGGTVNVLQGLIVRRLESRPHAF